MCAKKGTGRETMGGNATVVEKETDEDEDA